MTTTTTRTPDILTPRGLRQFHIHSALVWQGIQNRIDVDFAAGIFTAEEYAELSEMNRQGAVIAFDYAARKGTLLCC
jgi:hypothetical protein